MKKTRELIKENLKLVDLVIEVVDARIPRSSRNPVIDELTASKPRFIALNKCDLADSAENDRWIKALSGGGRRAFAVDSMHGSGIKELMRGLESAGDDVNRNRTRRKPLRLMIVGVPNVGKSSLINRLTGRRSAKTGDRPGVTRGKQWLALRNGMQLLDTPGILWPKFEDRTAGINLAFCGSIRDEILDTETLALELIKVLQAQYPQLLMARYGLDELDEDALVNMESIAARRGFILAGKRTDYGRCAKALLDDFRSSAIGRITLERS